jgi:hypothetical protein
MDSANVDSLHFSPWRDHDGARARGCYACRYFEGRFFSGTFPLCERPGGVPIHGAPLFGCSFWEREPGADDE